MVHRVQRGARALPGLLVKLLIVSSLLTLALATTASARLSPSHPTVPGLVDQSVLKSAPAGLVVAQGTLSNSAGWPSAGSVAALALPDEHANPSLKIGDAISTPTVGWAQAGRDGRFSLRVDPARVPQGYVISTGSMNLLLVAWNGTSETRQVVPVKLGGVVSAQSRASTSTVMSGVNLRLTDSIVSAPSARTAPIPYAITCYFFLVDTWVTMVTEGESFPFPGSYTKSAFHIGSSYTVTLGAAYSGSGTYGTWGANGSYSMTNGFTLDFGASTADRSYQEHFEYGKYRNTCGGSATWTWPIKATGGAATPAAARQDWCNYYDVPEPGNFTFTRSASNGYGYSLNAGVLAAATLGINLSFASNWSSDRWVNYKFVYPGYMCGNNDWPAWASRINEGSPWPQK